MKNCPFCQATIQDDARVCYNCGSQLDDTAPTQPVRVSNPIGQPANTDQPSGDWQPSYPPPAPTLNHAPNWPLLIAGLGLVLVIACGLSVFALIITANNGVKGLGAQVSTQIVRAIDGAGSGDPQPSATAPSPTAWPTFTPVPTATLEEPTATPNPTQASITNKLLSPECKASLEQLSKLSEQIKADPLKVLDENWRKDMEQASTDLKTSCGSFDSASPIPGEIGQLQTSMNQATSEFDQAKLLWNQAIDEKDPSKAISAAQHVGEATKYLSEAISQLQKLVP